MQMIKLQFRFYLLLRILEYAIQNIRRPVTLKTRKNFLRNQNSKMSWLWLYA